MIKSVNDKSAIKSLWKNTFGDTEEEILFFLNNADYSCLGYTENGVLVSMLFLVSCSLNGEKAEYIYAACTDKNYRSKGIMTELVEHCKKEFSLLCLIPAEDSLINYYYERGFTGELPLDAVSFNERKEICKFLIDGFELTNPKIMYYKR